MYQFLARAGAEIARGISTALIVRGGSQPCPACEPRLTCGVCPVLDCPECHCAPHLQCPTLEYSPQSTFHQEGISVVFLLGCLAVAAGSGYLAGRRGSAPGGQADTPPSTSSSGKPTQLVGAAPPVLPRPASAIEDVQQEAQRQARAAAASALARR